MPLRTKKPLKKFFIRFDLGQALPIRVKMFNIEYDLRFKISGFALLTLSAVFFQLNNVRNV
jgi:hypothetical protein